MKNLLTPNLALITRQQGIIKGKPGGRSVLFSPNQLLVLYWPGNVFQKDFLHDPLRERHCVRLTVLQFHKLALMIDVTFAFFFFFFPLDVNLIATAFQR